MSSDPMKQAWNDVAEGFSTLGRMMKERYRGASGDDLDRMERKLDREGRLPDVEQLGGRNPGGRGESTTRDQSRSAGKG